MRIQATVLTFGILTIFSGTVMASSLGTLNSFSAGEPAVAEDVNSNFSTIETAVNDNDSRITAVEGKTTTNESKLTDLETKTTTNESKLTDLETRVTDNETNISNNAESINSLSQVKTRSIWLPPTTGGSSPVVDLQGANKNTVVNATIGKPADYVSQGTDDVNLTIYIHAKLCEGLDIAVGAVTGGYDVGDVNSADPITPSTVAVVNVPSDGSINTVPLIALNLTQTGFKDVNVVAIRRNSGDGLDTCNNSVFYYGTRVTYPAN